MSLRSSSFENENASGLVISIVIEVVLKKNRLKTERLDPCISHFSVG